MRASKTKPTGRWTRRMSRPLLALATLCVPSAAAAGAWTLEKGRGLVIVTGVASRAGEGFADRRDRAPIPGFRKMEIQVLAEYGMSDRFTPRLRTEVRDVRQAGADPERRRGLGFSEVGGRYRLYAHGGFVASAEANLRLAEVQDIVDPAQSGLLEAEYEARVLAGHGFELMGRPSFVNGELAYRVRAGERPDEIKAEATFGIRPVPRLQALAQLFGTVSTGAEGGQPAYDYHKLQLSGVYDLTPRVAVQLGGFTTLAGRNALDEEGALAALWLRF